MADVDQFANSGATSGGQHSDGAVPPLDASPAPALSSHPPLPPPTPASVSADVTARSPDPGVDGGVAGVDCTMDKPRDRIVILGRRRAGKTVYLARLYQQLWNSTSSLHMRALSGDTHTACMQVVDELAHGRWPASTLGAQYSDIEVTYRGEKHLLVALDYPGEVFRKAFVEDADTEDARELLDHVDRAAAVILLMDPDVVHSSSIDEVIDDDFGMVQAIHRIREWPGGGEIPIVAVFTKCDVRKRLLRDSGGLRAFFVTHYTNLVRAMGRFKIYASAAVHAAPDSDGRTDPSLARQPIGLIEPLEYCLKEITERALRRREEEAERQRREAIEAQIETIKREKRRAILFWSLFWSVAIVGLAAVALVTWLMNNGG